MSGYDKSEIRMMGYCLADKKYLSQTINRVNPNYLNKRHKELYMVLVEFFNKYKSIPTKEVIETHYHKEKKSEDDLVNLINVIYDVKSHHSQDLSEADFKMVMDQLMHYQRNKQMIEIAEMIVDVNPHKTTADVVDNLKKSVYQKIVDMSKYENKVNNEAFVEQTAKSRWEQYLEIEKNPDIIEAIPSGFETFDRKNIGWRKGQLVYFVGRQGTGKSVALLNTAHSAWKNGKNVIIFTLEISRQDYEHRFDSRAAEIDYGSLTNGKLNENDRKRYINYLKYCEKQQLQLPHGEIINTGRVYIVDTIGCNPAFIATKVDELEKYHEIKFDLIVVDYAGIMKSNTEQELKRNEQGDIAQQLKELAREKECVVITASQMNREGGKSKSWTTAMISESDQIANHCDIIIALKLSEKSERIGKMKSIKTRSCQPFEFLFEAKYEHMMIIENTTLEDWELEEKDNKKGEW